MTNYEKKANKQQADRKRDGYDNCRTRKVWWNEKVEEEKKGLKKHRNGI